MSGNCRVVLRHPVKAKRKLSMREVMQSNIFTKNKFMKLQLNNYSHKIYIYM
jgi:hypothetical protein